MDEKDDRTSTDAGPLPDGASPQPGGPSEQTEQPRRRPIEKFYDKFAGVPLKALDIFIGVLIAAFVILVVLGYLKGHDII